MFTISLFMFIDIIVDNLSLKVLSDFAIQFMGIYEMNEIFMKRL